MASRGWPATLGVYLLFINHYYPTYEGIDSIKIKAEPEDTPIMKMFITYIQLLVFQISHFLTVKN